MTKQERVERMALYQQGKTDAEIAKLQGVAPVSVRQWRQKNKLHAQEKNAGPSETEKRYQANIRDNLEEIRQMHGEITEHLSEIAKLQGMLAKMQEEKEIMAQKIRALEARPSDDQMHLSEKIYLLEKSLAVKTEENETLIHGLRMARTLSSLMGDVLFGRREVPVDLGAFGGEDVCRS